MADGGGDGDTIFAVATPVGRGAIAVIRISGALAHDTVAWITGRKAQADRRMRLRRLLGTEPDDILDDALVVCFPANGSATGEPCAELHVHGGVAVVRDVLARLAARCGLRPARPGEFARRALAHGRLDLVQLESLADLVDAETTAQRRQAIRLAAGALSDRVETWRTTLLAAMALLEASLDFSEDVDLGAEAEARIRITDAMHELDAALAGARGAALVRDGFEIALIGPPNAGKSSLLNRIAGRDVALTHASPGTTRDVIEARCIISGRLVTVIDTAGMRDAVDTVEQAGVAWGRRRASSADMRIAVSSWDAPVVMEAELHVWNKVDVMVPPTAFAGVAASTVTGVGIDGLLERISAHLDGMVGGDGLLARARHVERVADARAHLAQALDSDGECAAEELRLALRSLDVLLGRVDVEAVLDEVFSRFCIGK